jgi:transposase-like protein
MTGKKGMTNYPLDVKLEAVRLFLEEGWTQVEIRDKLGLRTKRRVQVWARQYREEGVAGLSKPRGPRPKQAAESTEEELIRLRMENELLKKLQAELRKEELGQRNIGSSGDTERDTK